MPSNYTLISNTDFSVATYLISWPEILSIRSSFSRLYTFPLCTVTRVEQSEQLVINLLANHNKKQTLVFIDKALEPPELTLNITLNPNWRNCTLSTDCKNNRTPCFIKKDLILDFKTTQNEIKLVQCVACGVVKWHNNIALHSNSSEASGRYSNWDAIKTRIKTATLSTVKKYKWCFGNPEILYKQVLWQINTCCSNLC